MTVTFNADDEPAGDEPGSDDLRRLRDELHAAADSVIPPVDLLPRAQARHRRHTRRRQRVVIATTAAVAGAMMAFTWAWLPRPEPEPPSAGAANPEQAAFTYTTPAGWVATAAENSTAPRVELRPPGDGAARSFVTIEQARIPFDASAERQRWVEWLASREGSSGYRNFDANASFGGKTVIHYNEQHPGVYVDWYVMAKGTVQVFVGCQYVASGSAGQARAACENIVASLSIDSDQPR
ncbi:type VII secretion-associated protein [Amycolatopsis albispora]|uniref:Type VII secretion-associated protein n=1 Tax=Amycolatopsis albispora TaxID=1804986 RepID=A0A344L1A6_9PSEU|nr:type VII secretion-associated protein [Amycolatopsis albispora]AXB41830.1 hypothetical protein A4R43_04210 [Amycolatopsis albispora]